MEKIPEIFKKVGYKHISEEELMEIYNNLNDNVKMYNVTFDFDEKTSKISNPQYEEYGKYIKRKSRKEKLKKLND